MSISELVDRLVALGATPEIIKVAVAAATSREIDEKKATRQARNRRYYERHRHIKTSETVLTGVLISSETVLNTSENDPSRMRARVLCGEEVKKEESKKEEAILADSSSNESAGVLFEPIEKKKRREIAEAQRSELQSFGEQWNTLAAKHGLPSIDFVKPGSGRERQALARLRELREDFSETVSQFLDRVGRSAFLTGREKDFRATFDWVCNLANFTKIMEGNYENKKKTTGNGYGGHR